MAIKRYIASADNTITNAFEENLSTRGTSANMGAADVLEVFSIYGQASSASVEKSRILVQFPISTLSSDISNGIVPSNASYYLRLFDVAHNESLPTNFTLEVKVVSGSSWDEGTGLDMNNYTDLGISNWNYARLSSYAALINNINVSSTPTSGEVVSITIPASYADFTGSTTFNIRITGSLTPAATDTDLYITTGSSNINVSAANLHNIIISGINGSAIANTSSIGASFANLKNYISASSSPFGGVDLYAKYTGSIGESIVLSGSTSNIKTSIGSTNFSLNIPWSSQGGDYYSSPVYTSYFDSGVEDLEIDITDTVNAWIAGTKLNYGLGLMLSSSLENSNSRSYYTKKFSARSSEYFYKRPIIEARWDSSRQDDRGNFYLSSSMVSAGDNLNTLFLYNYVRGQLKDINGVGTGNIYVNLYSTLGGTALTTAPQTPITGGWVSTGVYTASVALNSTASTVYDVWFSGSSQYHTGTITPKSFASSEYIDTDRKIISISNLKNAYSNNEYPKLRLYVRSKNWSPTIYTKATTDVQQEYIKNLYYRVYRVQDGLDVVVNAATASTNHTKVSYDISGSYFSLDMSLFEPGYMYALKFIIKEENNYLKELDQVFKFRVDQWA